MATERAMILAMMSSLTRLREIVSTKGACSDTRMGAEGFGETSGDCGARDVGASAMEADNSGEALGESEGSAESAGKDVQACNVCSGSDDQVVLGTAAVVQVATASGRDEGAAPVVVTSGAAEAKAAEWRGRRSQGARRRTHGLDRVAAVGDRCGGSGCTSR